MSRHLHAAVIQKTEAGDLVLQGHEAGTSLLVRPNAITRQVLTSNGDYEGVAALKESNGQHPAFAAAIPEVPEAGWVTESAEGEEAPKAPTYTDFTFHTPEEILAYDWDQIVPPGDEHGVANGVITFREFVGQEWFDNVQKLADDESVVAIQFYVGD